MLIADVGAVDCGEQELIVQLNRNRRQICLTRCVCAFGTKQTFRG